MTECPNGEMRDRLPDFVHEQLNATTRAAVAAHVAGCDACAAELALLRELRETLRSAPAVDVARIVAALPAPPRMQSGRLRRRGWRRTDWRIAAAVAALVVGGGSAAIVTGRLRRPDTPGSLVARELVLPRDSITAAPRPQEVAAAGLSIDADLSEASALELETLLEDLEMFDGLPAGEPEPPPTPSTVGEEGL
jgi:anti-sigma factor RsiW